MKEQTKNKGSVLVAKSAYNAQNAQFGLVIYNLKITTSKNFKRNRSNRQNGSSEEWVQPAPSAHGSKSIILS